MNSTTISVLKIAHNHNGQIFQSHLLDLLSRSYMSSTRREGNCIRKWDGTEVAALN